MTTSSGLAGRTLADAGGQHQEDKVTDSNRPAALITGVSGSIGTAAAAAFSDRGFECFGWDRVPPSSASNAKFSQCDLLNEKEVDDAVQSLLQSGASLMHVIAVAGGGDPDELSANDVVEESYDTFKRVVAANLFTAFMTVRATLPLLRQSSADRSITLISSINAYGGFGAPGYSAAKAGISGLVKALAPSLGKDKVRINSLVLGTVRTNNLLDLVRRRGLDQGYLDRLASRAALGRILTPDDVAHAAVTVAVDLIGMTGTEIILDNGQILSR